MVKVWKERDKMFGSAKNVLRIEYVRSPVAMPSLMPVPIMALPQTA